MKQALTYALVKDAHEMLMEVGPANIHQVSAEVSMFVTVTANPLHSAQGKHLCIAQESVEKKKSDVKRRYVILNSDTLTSTVFETKEAFSAAVSQILEDEAKGAKTRDSASDMFDGIDATEEL